MRERRRAEVRAVPDQLGCDEANQQRRQQGRTVGACGMPLCCVCVLLRWFGPVSVVDLVFFAVAKLYASFCAVTWCVAVSWRVQVEFVFAVVHWQDRACYFCHQLLFAGIGFASQRACLLCFLAVLCRKLSCEQ